MSERLEPFLNIRIILIERHTACTPHSIIQNIYKTYKTQYNDKKV